ncbi:MAG: ShlB/FhaC/HecB family hemolysin secretion/activation protein [Candidatus Omnitrophica bacterium]|nr:ShlB/FhaC/HecB family hemolysin secretion/activation protein [Candidatus Omnitrophota bacterium]MDD5671598.1 ShlB/FhaC/HecB family hemolysin secretion/activation protein [Candidatus Omnitrophota bacterium]
MKRFAPILIALMLVPPAVYAADERTTTDAAAAAASRSIAVLDQKVDMASQAQFVRKKRTKRATFEVMAAPPQAALPEKKLFISHINITGNTVMSDEVFRSLAARYENRECSLRELEPLVTDISRLYQEAGFLTSFAYVPVQKIENGALEIRVVEGKVGDFIVEGTRYTSPRRILAYNHLRSGAVLRDSDLRRTYRSMNEARNRTVKISFRKGTKPETTDILFRVRDRLPLYAMFSYDNEGVETSGKQRFTFNVAHINLLGRDDQLSVGTVFGKRFGYVFTQYIFPVPQTGTQWIAGFSHGQSTPMKELSPYGINSISQTYYAKINQSIWEKRDIHITMQGGLEFYDSRQKVMGGTYRRERLRILEWAPRVVFQDRFGGWSMVNQEFSFGLGLFGASTYVDPGATRQNVKPQFFRYRSSFFRAQKLFWGTQAHLIFQSQCSSRKLPSREQMELGGATSIRGYPEGDFLADTGARWTLEYLVPLFLIPADWKLPYSDLPLRKQIQGVAFMDEGYGTAHGASGQYKRHLFGLGGGLRVRLWDNLYARTEWAHAVGDGPISGPDTSAFYFRLQAEH